MKPEAPVTKHFIEHRGFNECIEWNEAKTCSRSDVRAPLLDEVPPLSRNAGVKPRIIVTFCVALCSIASGAIQTRPNFLFIYTDDQRWDALSVVQKEQGERARFPWFQTPNLDR